MLIMSDVIFKAKVQVTETKGKTSTHKVFEIEQRVSQDEQPAFAAGACHCATAHKEDNEPKKGNGNRTMLTRATGVSGNFVTAVIGLPY
jgi:hypothetical protein